MTFNGKEPLRRFEVLVLLKNNNDLKFEENSYDLDGLFEKIQLQIGNDYKLSDIEKISIRKKEHYER